jgi:hypothetical protein
VTIKYDEHFLLTNCFKSTKKRQTASNQGLDSEVNEIFNLIVELSALKILTLLPKDYSFKPES